MAVSFSSFLLNFVILAALLCTGGPVLAADSELQTIGQEQKTEKNEPESSAPEQTTYEGVQNNIYRSGSEGEPHVIIYYPHFGNEIVDEEIRQFVSTCGADYEREVQESLSPDEEKPSNYDMWEMTGFYTLERPNPDVVSVTFNIYSYSGGAHGNLFIRCLNYNLKTGKPLEFKDIFKNQEKALEILSQISEQKLRAELGDEVEEDMLTGGTAPEADNFLNLSLNPVGLFIEFQPYQVGPWSIGAQRVEVPLADLEAAGPNPEIWPAPASEPGSKD